MIALPRIGIRFGDVYPAISGLSRMRHSIALAILFFALCIAATGQSMPDSNPVLRDTANYIMPQEAADAGIEGTVIVGIHVDDYGKPTKAVLMVGPSWPCGTTPLNGLERLQATLSETILKLHFAPAIKDGKPVAKDIGFRIDLKNPKLMPKPSELDPVTGKPIVRVVSGGVINGKATSLPVPRYPAAARDNRDSGSVVIQVLIDEEGKVMRAGAVSGPTTLQFAARDAACSARFSPTRLQGNPVKVSGVITYNFNL